MVSDSDIAAETPSDPATKGEPETPKVAEKPHKPWWKSLWGALLAALTVIGTVTGVIQIIPVLAPNSTSASSLKISVKPVETELTPYFVVPVTADWSTFPKSTDHCSDEQMAWLTEFGERVTETYILSVRNTASTGATLTLREFRGIGEGTGAPAQSVGVVCDLSGAGESNLRVATLDVASGVSAVYPKTSPNFPDFPVVFTLTPGESGEIPLKLNSSRDFTGHIDFTTSLGTDVWDVTVPMGDNGTITFPGVGGERLVIRDGDLACAAEEDCDPYQVIADFAAKLGSQSS